MTARSPRIALSIVAAVAVALCVALPAVVAAPASHGPVRSVALVAPRWVYSDGKLDLGVRVMTRKAERRITAELDLIDAAGILRWHAYQSRTDLGSVTYEYSFSKAVRDLALAPGVFTLRTRVTSAGSATVERKARLIVMDRTMSPVPVCVIVRVAGTPSAEETDAARLTATDAADLGRLAVLHPELRLTASVPPFWLERWSGTASEEPTSASPLGADAIASLERAVEAGMPLLRGMYADPDLSGVATSTADLKRQAARGDAALAAFTAQVPVPTATATGFASLSGPLPESAAAIMAARGVRYAVTDTSSVLPARGAAVAGAYAIRLAPARGSAAETLTVLTYDRVASGRLADTGTAADLAAVLFGHAASGKGQQPLVLVVAVGSDGVRTSQLAESLDELAGMPWVRLVSAPEAATASGLPAATLREHPADPTPAPAGYWGAVAGARGRVNGLLAAAGSRDADAMLALDALLLAESRAWAGADGTWPLASRGLALAKAASEGADAVLSKVTLDAPSVTLPGSDGKAPVSITNESGRTLSVVLEATSSDVRIREGRMTVRLRPGENILSVPVSLGTATSGRVKVVVSAGGYRIAAATATVRASYQDRIVLLATVLVILAGLLFYIRRHVTRALAARPGPVDDDDGEY